MAFLESQEPANDGGRRRGNNAVRWVRVAVLVERLGDEPAPLGGVGIEFQTPDGEELIEKVGMPNLPEIRWKEELKHHSDWFKVARWPFLKDSRFYLRGINHKGEAKPTCPPEDGWCESEMPIDWVPLED